MGRRPGERGGGNRDGYIFLFSFLVVRRSGMLGVDMASRLEVR